MSFEVWLAFCGASLAILIIPGPTVMLTLSYALSHGRRVALVTAAGVALGDFVAMTLSMAGLGAILIASPMLFNTLKLCGAVYLIWLGVKLVGGEPNLQPARTEAEKGIFWHAFLVTALNPKSIVFFIAFAPQFIDPMKSYLPQITVMIVSFVLLAAVNVLFYAFGAGQLRDHIIQSQKLRWLNRIGGCALIFLGSAIAILPRG